MLHDARAVWRGIRRHGVGYQAEVRITGHPRSLETFPLDTDPVVMQAWRTREKRRLRELAPHVATGGFADEVREDYLPARAAMPGIKERTRHMELWIAEFGNRPSQTIQSWEIAKVRDRWLTVGPKRIYRRWADDHLPKRGGRWIDSPEPLSASQVNKRLRALENFYTVRYGRHGYNPVREVEEPAEPDAEARGLPYDVVEAILAQLPDRGRGERDGTRPKVSLTKLRLRVIAYTGLSHGELKRMTPADVDLARGWMRVPGRKKGKTTKRSTRPLVAQGVEAFRALDDADGWGSFSHSAMWKSFQRACRKLDLEGLTSYDFRHSFASETYDKTGDLKATQQLMGHTSDRTTLRYAERAVSPVLRAAIEKIRAAGGFTFAAPNNAPAAVKPSKKRTNK